MVVVWGIDPILPLQQHGVLDSRLVARWQGCGPGYIFGELTCPVTVTTSRTGLYWQVGRDSVSRYSSRELTLSDPGKTHWTGLKSNLTLGGVIFRMMPLVSEEGFHLEK